MKKFLTKTLPTLVLVATLLCTLLPQISLKTEAAKYEPVMTAYEFIEYLKIALGRKTKYSNVYPGNVGYYDGDTISWDCWNLGKTIIWTNGAVVNNYTPHKVMPMDTSCGLGDWTGDYIVQLSPNYSSDFSNLVPGEWVQMSGHTGYYIGDGQVIECTTVEWGANGVIVSQIDSEGNRSKDGKVSKNKWEHHGMIPWLDYEASPVVKKTYPAYCFAEVTSDATWIKSQPCDDKLDASSVNIESAVKGTSYLATKLVQNTVGELWYEVTAQNGETGYLYAGDSAYLAQKTDDLLITGAKGPDFHRKGYIYYLYGTISSTYNQLTGASAYVYDANGTKKTGTSVEVSGNSYTLKDSTIDGKTAFGTLAVGKHTYVVSATYKNYYAVSGTDFAENTGTVSLFEAVFDVVTRTTSCTHTYVDQTTVAATCVGNGRTTKTCSKCNTGYTVTLPATQTHSYRETIAPATCETDGIKTFTCEHCSIKYSEIIPAMGHSYQNNICTHCGVAGPGVTISGSVNVSTNIIVELWMDDQVFQAATVAEGVYTLENIAPGSYILKASSIGYAPRTYSISIATGTEAPEIKLCRFGDVIGDGKVNIMDVSAIYSHVRGSNTLEGYGLSCADTNGDGRTNIMDVSIIYSQVRGSDLP